MHILFTTQPGSSHFFSLAPLAKSLRERGHDVRFATAASFCPSIEASGFQTFPSGLDYLESEIERAFPQVRGLSIGEIDEFIVQRVMWDLALEPMVIDLLRVCETFRPAVIVRDSTEAAGCLAAEVAGVPHAAFTTLGFHLEPGNIIESGKARLHGLRARFGLGPDPGLEMLYRYLLLVALPPGWVSGSAALPTTAHWIQPPVFDAPKGEQLPDWVNTLPGLPTVYASLGTVYNRWGVSVLRRIIEAAQNEPVNLIATIGKGQDPATFGPVSPNVYLVPFIPQSLLMPRCSLVINHGGIGTTIKSLSFGVPVVILPLGADQPIVAARVEELRAGLRVLGSAPRETFCGSAVDPERLTAAEVLDAIETILNDAAYRIAAQGLQREIAEMPRPDRAAELIEDLVDRHQPITARATPSSS